MAEIKERIRHGDTVQCEHESPKLRIYYVDSNVTMYLCDDCVLRRYTSYRIAQKLGVIECDHIFADQVSGTSATDAKLAGPA